MVEGGEYDGESSENWHRGCQTKQEVRVYIPKHHCSQTLLAVAHQRGLPVRRALGGPLTLAVASFFRLPRPAYWGAVGRSQQAAWNFARQRPTACSTGKIRACASSSTRSCELLVDKPLGDCHLDRVQFELDWPNIRHGNPSFHQSQSIARIRNSCTYGQHHVL
jgi:hypothetical protein